MLDHIAQTTRTSLDVQPVASDAAMIFDKIRGKYFSLADMKILDEHRAHTWKRRQFHSGRVVRNAHIVYHGEQWTSPELKAYAGARIYLLGPGCIRLHGERHTHMMLLNQDLAYIGTVHPVKRPRCRRSIQHS